MGKKVFIPSFIQSRPDQTRLNSAFSYIEDDIPIAESDHPTPRIMNTRELMPCDVSWLRRAEEFAAWLRKAGFNPLPVRMPQKFLLPPTVDVVVKAFLPTDPDAVINEDNFNVEYIGMDSVDMNILMTLQIEYVERAFNNAIKWTERDPTTVVFVDDLITLSRCKGMWYVDAVLPLSLVWDACFWFAYNGKGYIVPDSCTDEWFERIKRKILRLRAIKNGAP